MLFLVMLISILVPVLLILSVTLYLSRDSWYTNKFERRFVSEKNFKYAVVKVKDKSTRNVVKGRTREYYREDYIRNNRLNSREGFKELYKKTLYFVEFDGDLKTEFEVNKDEFNALKKGDKVEITYYKYMFFGFKEVIKPKDPFDIY